MKPKLVLVGNGMVGVRTLEELLTLAPDLYDVVVFGDEPHASYNRLLLPPVLAGEKTFDEIVLRDRAWYARHGFHLRTGDPVASVDRGGRRVVTEDGVSVPYDRLILATGSTPRTLAVEGRDLDGVLTFRNLRDVQAMIDASRRGRRAVVVGGGPFGLEAAHGLLRRGMRVTVAHRLDHLMEKQLDSIAADLLKVALERRGLVFRMEATVEAFVGDGRVRAVRFADGTEEPADLVVVAVGMRPNASLAERAELPCDRGVVVNDVMQTFDPRIYAVGECARHPGSTHGVVAPLYEQAKVCANQLAEDGYFRYRESVVATRLKVTGIDVFSVGRLHGGDGYEEISFRDSGRGVYRKLVLQEDRVVGALLYGDTSDGSWYHRLVKDGTDVASIRDALLFGRAFAERGIARADEDLLDAPDDRQVCACNGVCKGEIVETIRVKGLTTLADVRTHTKASASCGMCSPSVERILEATLGDSYRQPEHVPMCGCTDKDHDEVREAIVAEGLKTIDAVMRALGWTTPDGCATCRPAINYYLVCAWPREDADDPQSRTINERVHANIQRDGTYSVVPRIWGGVTTPADLRAIAEIAERFEVPSVKITGGQRIDLLGVKKEALPAIWAELGRAGFVSGHAYGRAVRTVKTCVGEEWCRFGVQDSTRMGIDLERQTWGSWAPHKVKMGVSGCPRNCAEATIKDFGVVAIEGGWELYVGGNGGMKVRAADLLCRVTTEAEVLEYGCAFLQLYREEGHYLERTAHFVERIGIEYVRERIAEDPVGRRILFESFQESQTRAQVDPWAERAKGAHAGEFVPVSRVVTGSLS